MRTFKCECGARVFFINSRCVTCARELGFLPDVGTMATLQTEGDIVRGLGFDGSYRKCANQLAFDVCNWLVPENASETLCQSCRLNQVIPNLKDENNRALWNDVERAKRHLIYTLNQLRLPVYPKSEDPQGLAFNIMTDTPKEQVLTGHADGVITLNLREADPVSREETRVAMKEGYRTLLGHFRHEVGHYYWDLLVKDSPDLDAFRQLFGDERADYAAALEKHYGSGPATAGWQESFISNYAKAHPWEDWAESWAHVLHMVDTLETARNFAIAEISEGHPDKLISNFDPLIEEWFELTVVMNALNRSMGLPDAYPFAITDRVKEKLCFVAGVIANQQQARPGSATAL